MIVARYVAACLVGLLLFGLSPSARSQNTEPQTPAAATPASEFGYYVCRLTSLDWEDPDQAPTSSTINGWSTISPADAIISTSQLLLDGPGEAYLVASIDHLGSRPNGEIQRLIRREIDPRLEQPRIALVTPFVVFKVPTGQAVQGTLVFGDADRSDTQNLRRARFTIPAEAIAADARRAFLVGKLIHYHYRLTSGVTGTSWWNAQLHRTADELGIPASELPRDNAVWWGRFGGEESQFDLISGSRAVSENLQLVDMIARTSKNQTMNIPVDTIQGITIREFDWETMIKGMDPPLDSTSHLIPHDQHGLFFSSGEALVSVLQGIENHGLPILDAAEVTDGDPGWVSRYLRQMSLSFDDLQAIDQQFGIRSAAITGGDPYFAAGTDILLILESPAAEKMADFMRSKAAAVRSENPQFEYDNTDVAGLDVEFILSDDRELSCCWTRHNDFLLISNSIESLRQSTRAISDPNASLASLDEFRFMRNRYPMGRDHESCFLMISDATIRRWCSPAWRIGQSRRLRAAAVISEMTTANYRTIIEGKTEPFVDSDLRESVPLLDEVHLNLGKIVSKPYGTLSFLTPVRELEVTAVTMDERTGYVTWRENYENRWSNMFDPIGFQVKVNAESLSGDLTVMPLIERSAYDWLSSLTEGAHLPADAGLGAEGTVFKLKLALNIDTGLIANSRRSVQSLLEVDIDPFQWIGRWAEIYLDAGPWIEEFSKSDDPSELFWKRGYQLPFVVAIDVRSPVILTAVLAQLHVTLKGIMGEASTMEIREHQGVSYVRFAPNPQANERLLPNFELLYASGNPLLISLNEEAMKRAIDLRTARASDKAEAAPPTDPVPHRENLNVSVNKIGLQFLLVMGERQATDRVRWEAWKNIPILNEWRRLFPDQNPETIHQRLFQRPLASANGEGYQWNEEWQTMESVSFGHPGSPRTVPLLPPALRQVQRADFRLTYEEDGIRAQTTLWQTIENIDIMSPPTTISGQK